MQEKRYILLNHPNGCRDSYIKPGSSKKFTVEIPSYEGRKQHFLRVIGESDVCWQWRKESGNPYILAESIEDALYKDDIPDENYSLRIHANGEKFERNAYILLKKEMLAPGKRYKFRIRCKTASLELLPGGEALCELGIYRKKEGRAQDDVFDMPDIVRHLKAPEGSCDWITLQDEFILEEDAVCILVRIGVRLAKGNISFGSPQLWTEGKDNPIPPYDLNQSRFPHLNYLGENLDRRCHPFFEIQLDDKTIFCGEKYSPIYRRPFFTLFLGKNLETGKHSLEIALKDDYPTSPGFMVLGLELLERSADPFEVVAYPEFFPEKTSCPVLLRTNEDNVTVNGCFFEKKGTHVLTLAPMECTVNHRIQLESTSCRKEITLRQITKGKKDSLRLSSSDAIFIPQTREDFQSYLEWYTSNRIGNTMRFRCCYRWSGSRSCEPEVWAFMIPVLEKLNMDYVIQLDGRELPGKNANPPPELVQGPHYLGRQAHENDGSFYYWGNSMWNVTTPAQPQGDILARSIDPGGILPHIRPPRNHGVCYRFFDPANVSTMKEASEAFIKNLATARGKIPTRHSGPSTLFRYFFQAGYEYLEAEQMYGPEEVILASLRGASKGYGKKEFGAHLAAQWSSTPHDTKEHAERYFLSLCSCYLQGCTQINLEEGLYRMEKDYADYDLYSQNCQRHLEAHTRFRRFMETRRRRGTMTVPLGIVQGRHDGWSCFNGKRNVWCREGDRWQYADPEKSFELLHYYYPRSLFEDIYRCPCSVAPQGWYTGTPYGPVDLFPSEGDFSHYDSVIFLGWHTFVKEDAQKFLSFVKNGGRLLLTKAHLSAETERNKPMQILSDPALEELLGEDYPHEKGVIRRTVGKGTVVCFMEESYPASLEKEYQTEMEKITESTLASQWKKGWIHANEDVNFSVWDVPAEEGRSTSMRVIYLLNIRWWDPKTSHVTLRCSGNEYSVAVPYGEILTLTLAGDKAILCRGLADVFAFDGSTLSLQSPDPGKVQILSAGKVSVLEYPAGISVHSV